METRDNFAWRLGLLYFTVATLWILLSDTLLVLVISDTVAESGIVSIIKGLGFVSVTAVMLFLLVHRELERRHEIERVLQLREAQLRLLTDQMPLEVWTVDHKMEVDAHVGDGDIAARLHDDRLRKAHRQAIIDETTTSFEAELAEATYQIIVKAFHDEQSRVIGSIAAALDITEHKRHEDRLQAILEALPVAIVITGHHDGLIRYANPAAAAAVGTPRHEMLGRPVVEYYANPQDRAALIEQLKRDGEIRGHQLQMLGPDGEPRWTLMSTQPITFNDEPAHLGAVIDIHDSKEAALALQASEARYRNLINNPNLSIAVYDRAGRIQFINQHGAEQIGQPAEAVVGQSLADIFPADLSDVYLKRVQRVIDTGESDISEDAIPSRRFGTLWFLTYTHPLPDAAGNISAAQVVAINIAERMKAHRALLESEERYRNLVEAAPVPIIVHSQGKAVFLNPAAVRVLGGASADDYLGKSVWNFLHPDYHEIAKERVQQVYSRTSHVEPLEERFIRSDGSEIIVEVSATYVDYEGQPASQVVFIDITDRKRAEEALRRSEEAARAFQDRLKALHQVSIELLSAHNEDALYRQAVELGCSRLGFDRLGLFLMRTGDRNNLYGTYGMAPDGIVKDEYDVVVPIPGNSKLHEALQTKQWALMWDDAPLYHGRDALDERGWRGMVALWDGNSPQGMLFADNLLTGDTPPPYQIELLRLYGLTLAHQMAQRRAQNALRQSEARYRSLVANAPMGIGTADRAGHIISLNEAMQKMMGLEQADLDVVNLADIYADPNDRARLLEQLETRGAVHGFETKLRRKDGTIFDSRLSVTRLDLDDEPIVVTIAEDISERTAARLALQESESRYRALFENANDGILLMDGPIFIACNPMILSLFACRREDIIGQPPYRFSPPTQPDGQSSELKAMEKINAALAGQPQRFEWTHTRLDGTEFSTEVALNRLELSGQVYLQAQVRDITDRKVVEVERLERERLRVALEKEKELSELKSRFMSIISHEFRTPLAVISTINGMLSQYWDRLSPADRDQQYERVQQQIERLDKMLDEVSLVNRVATGHLQFDPQPIDVVGYVGRLVDEAQLSMAPQHRLVYESDSSQEEVDLDAELLRHIVNNLLQNAIKYSPDGSEVRLALHRQAERLRLQIDDKGIGIMPEDRERLFEPYHRGKNVGAVPGSGLGLKIVKDCVDLHGGDIYVESTPGHGSSFIVELPV